MQGVGRREAGDGEKLSAPFGRAVVGGGRRAARVGRIGRAQESIEAPAGLFNPDEIGPAPVLVRKYAPFLRPRGGRKRIRPQDVRGLRDGQDVVAGGKLVRSRGQGHRGPGVGAGQVGDPFQPEGDGGSGGNAGPDRHAGDVRLAQFRVRGGDGAKEMRLQLRGGAGGRTQRAEQQRACGKPTESGAHAVVHDALCGVTGQGQTETECVQPGKRRLLLRYFMRLSAFPPSW